jgi:hypothetical protein
MVSTPTPITVEDTIAITIGRTIIIDRITIIVTGTAVITDIEARQRQTTAGEKNVR